MTLSDDALIEMFREPATQNKAFDLLVHKYQEQLYWVVRRLVVDHDDANDIIQNVFIKVWNNLGNFREDSKLYTWLYRIAINESLGFLNSKRMRLFVPLVDVEKQLNQKLADDNYFDGNEIQLMLQKAILKLPEKQRIVFNLRYYNEMPYEDMSEVLGTSVGALKASYHLAMKKIEKSLTGN
ncbi:MAG: sigma-70 family RNA polymerase sigma factor [Bacteroidota bacterium]|nr:sigma-70 family RNA polymerase sigma factor [Bacteroidota bacterium]